ncbi:hypothetical protein BC937DRAFT_89728 [Endogone sp. FLAS-F59071]|nr:hypothetical protein BC937DRAFT_89728 [Endogone sp. FLAS-F59071]|eukprot:RUS23258.1 hypothetical protein BC937DRAFT_89728 [Endogone sp. FLAS-F59071]
MPARDGPATFIIATFYVSHSFRTLVFPSSREPKASRLSALFSTAGFLNTQVSQAPAHGAHANKQPSLKAGERIAQLILERIYTPEVVEVEDLEDTDRGVGGFGSTGKQ